MWSVAAVPPLSIRGARTQRGGVAAALQVLTEVFRQLTSGIAKLR